MLSCVIFNPVAKGDKARRFRRHLDEFAAHCTVKPTACAGDARRLAAEAVREGCRTVIAAGGDGTVNEVLNGIGDVPEGFERTRLAVLPLGTVNVFARELALPLDVERAWQTIVAGAETLIDLPCAEYVLKGGTTRRYFAQLGGAGLDARAVELVHWPLKKKIGPLAYVWAGLQALLSPASRIKVTADGQSLVGELVLIGNGKFYGGNYRVFPKADLRDGLLDVRVFPKVNWFTLARCGPQLVLTGSIPDASATQVCGKTIRLESEGRTPVEIDGELAGVLPATFSIEPLRLRVVAPQEAAS